MICLTVSEKRKRNRKRLKTTAFLLAVGLLSGCQGVESSGTMTGEQEVQLTGEEQIDSISIIDDMSVYAADDPDSIAYFYVTVRYGSEARGTNHTFAEVNNTVRFLNGEHAAVDVYAEALVQAGDENGPVAGMIGYGETASNATIRIRGNTSSAMPVKSYKLKLNDNVGTWRGQTNLAMNKHIFDPTRFRNKLYFDILKDIPEVPSLRTQFVIMYIKDETAGETEFKNYGLFTQVEVPTKKYLKNHGMDSSGYLYKVISFNWEKNDLVKNIDDPEYDAAAMDTVLSCRGREDNAKLIELIDAVNDMSLDINYVIDTYFDRDNYVTWLAYNILMGNTDTTMQNYYLYSPLNGNKWYFIPWDGDGSLLWQQKVLRGTDADYGEWECGISNYWGVLLHQRFLKYASNREELAERVEELYAMLSKEYLQEKIDLYNSVVEPYASQMPDLLHLQYTLEERDYIVETLVDEVEDNYEKFRQTLTNLMPFWIYVPLQENDTVMFRWGDAYDFSAKAITYDLKVSRYPDMREPVIVAENLDVLSYTVDESELEKGTYYMEVIAYSSDGRSTKACNKIKVDDESYPGVLNCTIK